MKTNYHWKRKWKPVDSSDASVNPWMYLESEKSIITADLYARSQLLVLLGGLGMGKTTEIKRLTNDISARLRNATFVKASALVESLGATIKDIPDWNKHKNGEAFTLLIDGIDEVLPYSPDFLEALSFFLQNNRSPHLNVILGMRSTAWQQRSAFDDLFKTWKTSESLSVLELLPLTQDDIRLVFTANSASDADDFLEWVHKMDAMPMAGCPLYIDEVIRMWRSEPAKRPSIHKLRDTQIDSLLLETPERTGKQRKQTNLSSEKLKALAEVVAVHSILAGRPKLGFGMSLPESTDTLDLLSFLNSPINAEWKVDDNVFNFSETDLRALVDRPLFETSLKQNQTAAISFSHHSFAERLAGRCLFRQPVERVIRMLANPELTRIVPQMQAITALLAPSDRALMEWLFCHQPKILLSSDATEFDPHQRGRIVKAVLNEIEQSDENDRLSWTAVDTGFRGAEVVTALLEVISNKSLNVLTRIAALVIAERNPQNGMEEVLRARLNDSTEESIIRKDAVDAWIAYAKLDVSTNYSRLWEIARGEAGRGKAHDKADALRVLLKCGTPVRDIIIHVPSKDENHGGSLDYLLSYDMPRRISREDIPACLKYMNHAELSPYENITELSISKKVYQLSFQNLQDDEISGMLADHFWDIYTNQYRHIREVFRSQLAELSSVFRRKLISALLNSKERPEQGGLWNLPIETDDFEWIVRNYHREELPGRDTWKLLIQTCWRQATEKDTPSFLIEAYYEGTPEFRGLFPIPRRGRSIIETISRFHLAGKRYSERASLKYQRRLAKSGKRIGRDEFTKIVMDQLRSDPISGWVNFSNNAYEARLSIEEKKIGKRDKIAESLGWNGLSEEGQQLARNGARKFLLEKYFEHVSDRWTTGLEASYQAIDLLHDEIQPLIRN